MRGAETVRGFAIALAEDDAGGLDEDAELAQFGPEKLALAFFIEQLQPGPRLVSQLLAASAGAEDEAGEEALDADGLSARFLISLISSRT